MFLFLSSMLFTCQNRNRHEPAFDTRSRQSKKEIQQKASRLVRSVAVAVFIMGRFVAADQGQRQQQRGSRQAESARPPKRRPGG